MKWDKISNLSKKGFESEPVYNDKNIENEINTFNIIVNTNFHGNKKPEDNECCICLSIILLDSVVIIDDDYYLQFVLEECKYAVKWKKIINAFNEKLNLDESDDDDKSNKSEENSKNYAF